METISPSDTDAASNSRFTRQTASSHSTWRRLNGSSSPSFDQPLGTETPSAAQNASTVFQRRRVNPESLALRLGPDLVRDLEALIHPGNIEMPSFAVRKELQERYNIDRRHVYDYFHSRGLRVIKEDKNGNTTVPNDFAPVPARSPKSNLNLRTLRQAPVKESQRATVNLISKLKETKPPSKPRGVTKAKPGRPRKYAVRSIHDDPLPPAVICPSSRMARAISPILQPDILPASDPNDEFDMAVSTIDESYSFAQAIDEVAYTYRGPPVLMFETSPLHTLSNAVPDLRTDGAELGLSPRKASADPLSPNTCTLSATERVALYQLLSGAFGTPRDIHECAGTYRNHMQERSKLYYEGLLAVPYQNSRYNDRRPASSDNHQSVPCNGSEYSRWVNPGEFCILDDKASVRNSKPVKPDTSTIRQKAQVNFDIDNEAHPLDTLFPIFDLNRTSVHDSIGESPVIRSRRQSYVPLDFYFLQNEERGEAEDLLLDAASNSGTPELPNHSVSLQSKIRGGSLHGHPDFPGSPPLLPSAEFHHVDVNPRPALPLQQPASSPNVDETSALTLAKQKSSRKSVAPQTRFAPCTPQKHLRQCDRIRTRSFTSRSARIRTTSAGGGI
ncbi:hypothetical protein DFJ58DRAFT_433024 [Suillus subalutaceus]|uniref:uncharacterized protein n=1 Tax=Suillus subalutaceus TaxID=48586 RepID=UPI001B867AAB|nr:uncharacterized protein DFJ58DRAFT_433024 [Suillus subalutaceus]KAG1850606.1 hypothetical protein DFJ58DRAFT_433024 [Suillus subalutaceus]